MTNAEFKAIRSKLKLSQKEFGSALGFVDPQGQVSRIETGKVGVSKQVEIICLYIQRYGILPEFRYQRPIPEELIPK